MRVLSKLRTYANAGRFTVVNATCTRKDGTTFPAEIAVSQINLLNEGDFIFSIRNLERREKARERHEMEIDALEYAGAGIVVCRADGLIAFANPAFVRLLRLAESKDVLNHFIGDFCTSYEAANALMKTPSAHGSWFGRLELRVATGETVETLATATQSQRKKEGAANIVLTLTPLPKAVV
jgi:PAS domain-containing protein